MINTDLTKIKAIALDVDGVLSKSTLLLTNDGTAPMRTTNIKDGYAIQLSNKMEIKVLIITGGNNESIFNRYRSLGCNDVFLSAKNKKEILSHWCLNNNILPSEMMYMGDDIPDLEAMKWVGCPVCPNDAVIDIKQISIYISPIKGGEGCVRDVIEQVLRSQNKWACNSTTIKSI